MISTMFEICEGIFLSGRHTRILRGAWVSRAPLDIIVSGHGHRLECGRCFDCNGLEYMCYAGFFCPVSGFPIGELFLFVLGSYLSRSALLASSLL